MLRPRPNFKFARRVFSASATANSRVYVAPPDPISHIRPVIYDDISSQKRQPPAYHQYSLEEFDVEPSGRLVSADEQLWKMQRQQLDDFEQHFWLDTNTRFEAAKQATLDSLPPYSSPLDKEKALSEFYRQWVMQEDARLRHYTDEWRRRNVATIILAARVRYHQFTNALAQLLRRSF